MPYYEKRITSGKLLEVERYFATRDGRRISRGENQNETPEDQQRINDRHAQRRLMRLINANFDGKAGDVLVTFTHKDTLTEAQARKEARNLINRLDRLRSKKELPELKYIIVTEHQSKWHHHLIMNGGLSLEEIGAVWNEPGRLLKNGTAKPGKQRGRWQVSTLDDTYAFEDLARYLTTEHKPPKGKPKEDSTKEPRPKYARRWNGSRNLVKPKVEKRPIKRPPSAREPKAPKGYRLLPNWVNGCDRFGNLFQYYACVKDGGGAESRNGQRKRE